jgi:ribosomal protein L39E
MNMKKDKRNLYVSVLVMMKKEKSTEYNVRMSWCNVSFYTN